MSQVRWEDQSLSGEQVREAWNRAFAEVGLAWRAEGQRRAKDLYDLCDFYDPAELRRRGFEIRDLGEAPALGHHGSTLYAYELFAGRDQAGTWWAFYRFKHSGGGEFVTCQATWMVPVRRRG